MDSGSVSRPFAQMANSFAQEGVGPADAVCTENLKPGRSGDEVRQEWGAI
jgi:hypothetical protein